MAKLIFPVHSPFPALWRHCLQCHTRQQFSGLRSPQNAPPMQSMCSALFPAYSRLVTQRLVEVVQRGTEQYQVAAISVLQVIFEVRVHC